MGQDDKENTECLVFITENGDSLVLTKSVVAIIEHEGCEAAHGRMALSMEIAHHGVTVPMAEHLHEVMVDPIVEQGHGTTGAKRAAADFSGVDAVLGKGEGSMKAQEFCDVLSPDWDVAMGSVIVTGKDGTGTRVMETVIDNQPHQGLDGTAVWVRRETMD